MHAFAQLTVPEIKAGLFAVIAIGGAAAALFVAVAMLLAAARAVARCIARFGRAGKTLLRQGSTKLAPGRAG